MAAVEASETGSEKQATKKKAYEFDEQANVTFRGLSGSMKAVAVLQLVAGVLLVAAAALELRAGHLGTAGMFAVQALLNAIVSYWLMGSSRHFGAVAETRGKDIAHLMSALGELRKMFRLHRALIIGGLVFLVGGAVTVVMTGGGTPTDMENPGRQQGEY